MTVLRHEEIDSELKNLLKKNNIAWDEHRGYVTNLHKDLYLKESEAKSEKYLREYCDLVQYLKEHLEYGVNKEWSDSELNKYVYMLNKDMLKKKFKLVIDSLSRFYDDSDIIAFYKNHGGKEPTIIDLIGTTGAGKTTFCQQFVDDISKELLKLTITDSSESTVIQTDILILDNTEKKLFLKVRNKSEIISDLLTVALEYDFNSNGRSVRDNINKNSEITDKDTIDKVSNFFATDGLFNKFKYFADNVQEKFKESTGGDKFEWIQKISDTDEFDYFLFEIIGEEANNPYFYGYRKEYDLEAEDAEDTIITTLANTEFKYRKEDIECYPEYEDAISYRLLYDHAILILPCSDKAKKCLDYDFKQGLVFRDSQGHKLDDQNGMASDFEVKNKIFLIPIDTGGYLIDDRYSNIFEKILISEPKNNLFVLTKIDTNNTYRAYKKGNYEDDKKFSRDFSEKISKTHNKLLSNFKGKTFDEKENAEFLRDETIHFENFMASFDNAYLSEIEEDTYESEAHKITYTGQALNDFDKSKLSIQYLESWFDIVGNVLKQNRLTYHENMQRLQNVDNNDLKQNVNTILSSANTLVKFYIKNMNWSNELEKQLEILDKGFDFRTIYQNGASWYLYNFTRDGVTSNTNQYFKDYTSSMLREIKSYLVKSSNENYVKSILQKDLTNYLSGIYSIKSGNSVQVLDSLSNTIISNSFEKAIKISYKLYDRDLKKNGLLLNMIKIYNDTGNMYVKPTVKTYNDILLNKRKYSTKTEQYEGIYANLLSKFKYNLQKYFSDVFRTVLESELNKLDEMVK